MKIVKINISDIEMMVKESITRVMQSNDSIAKTESSNVMKRFYGIKSNGHKPIMIEHITLDRIVKKHGSNGYIIVSGNRSDKSQEINDLSTQSLCKQIKTSGYSFLPVLGYRGVNGVEDDYEPSFIVFNYNTNGESQNFDTLYQLGLKWCADYDQESITVKSPDAPPMHINREGEKINDTESYDYWKNDARRKYFTSMIPKDKTQSDKPSRRFTLDIGYNGDDGLVHECLFVNPSPCTLNERMRRGNEIILS